jgi:hypothetical protein
MDIRKFLKRKSTSTPERPAVAPEHTPSPKRVLSAVKQIFYTPSRVIAAIDRIISKRRADLQSRGKQSSGQSNPVSIIDYAELGPGALDELIARGKTAKGVFVYVVAC